MSVPAYKKVFSCATSSQCSHARLSQGHGCTRSTDGPLALCPDDAKQDPVVYGTEFGVVFLAKGSRTAFLQEGLDCLGPYHSDIEGELYLRLVAELTYVPPDHPTCAGTPGDFKTDMSGVSVTAPPR